MSARQRESQGDLTEAVKERIIGGVQVAKGGEFQRMMTVQGTSGVPESLSIPSTLTHKAWLQGQLVIPEPPSLLPSFSFGQETKDSLGKGLGKVVFVLFCFSRQGYTDTGQMSSYFREGQRGGSGGDFVDPEALLREGKAQISQIPSPRLEDAASSPHQAGGFSGGVKSLENSRKEGGAQAPVV